MSNLANLSNNGLTVQGYPARTGAYVPKTVQGLQSLFAWKKEASDLPDYWLREVICRAFQQMLYLRLDGVPAAETIVGTAEMWVAVIGPDMVPEIDQERLTKGFGLLMRKIKRWPQPSELLEILPTRMRGSSSSSKTMEAPMSDEAHAAASAKFDEILESMK